VDAQAEIAALKAENAALKAQATPDTAAADRIRKLEQDLAAARRASDNAWHHARRGVKFEDAEYLLIKGCLHPDGFIGDPRHKKYERAFKLFSNILPEEKFREKKPNPNEPAPKKRPPPDMPRTSAEWDAAKRRATEERKAKRRKRREGTTRRTLTSHK
jgi:hypothetical protein